MTVVFMFFKTSGQLPRFGTFVTCYCILWIALLKLQHTSEDLLNNKVPLDQNDPDDIDLLRKEILMELYIR